MSAGRLALFLLVLTALLGAASFYFHRRASALLRLGRRGRRALAGVLAVNLAVFTLSRLLGRVVPDRVLATPVMVASNVGVAILMTVSLALVIDLVEYTVSRVRRALSSAPPAPFDEARPEPEEPAKTAPSGVPEDSGRRSFLSQAAMGSAFVIGGGSAAYGAIFGRHDYQLEEISVAIPGLRGLDGLTLAQLSDIHIGMFVGEPELRAAEALLVKARPDIIVLTGDLIDHDRRYLDELGRFVRRLGALAPKGVVVIPGNHDYYTGIDATLATVAGAGARVLRNDGLVLGDRGGALALLGVDDVWGSRVDPRAGPDVDRAIAAVPADLPRVLLCHNPSYFPRAADRVALQLSGHTHGGQVNLGFVRPADWVLPYGYVKGMYQRGGSRLYVNRGFGTAGPPSRVGSPPEVTRVVLVSA